MSKQTKNVFSFDACNSSTPEKQNKTTGNITRFLNCLHLFQILNLGDGKKRQISISQSVTRHCDRRNSAIKQNLQNIKRRTNSHEMLITPPRYIGRCVKSRLLSLIIDSGADSFFLGRLHTEWQVNRRVIFLIFFFLNKGQPASQPHNFPSFDLFWSSAAFR